MTGLAVAAAGLLPATERQVCSAPVVPAFTYTIPVSKSRIARNAVFASRVKIDDDRPYLVWFSAVTASG